MSPEFIIKSLKLVNDEKPWYGKSISKILTQDLEPNTQAGKAHSIGQILQHMVSWRQFAIEKLKGNAEFLISLEGKDNFDTEKNYTKDEYRKLIQTFQQCQEELISLIESREGDAWLDEIVPGSKYNMGYLLQGIIHHDVYHAGQIALLHASVKD